MKTYKYIRRLFFFQKFYIVSESLLPYEVSFLPLCQKGSTGWVSSFFLNFFLWKSLWSNFSTLHQSYTNWHHWEAYLCSASHPHKTHLRNTTPRSTSRIWSPASRNSRMGARKPVPSIPNPFQHFPIIGARVLTRQIWFLQFFQLFFFLWGTCLKKNSFKF